jgi:hypothetical protein
VTKRKKKKKKKKKKRKKKTKKHSFLEINTFLIFATV